ncbi:hypothetical protein [Stigmatella erecta]|uniref:Uncharacterized protein n=1 Tax=Stigmatella erecta TaxID=83460 RepID=A0A1I0AP84_9BACT|nr:hypothetical protein [Stigmatella erecta]SES96068.1 hypothetical protein SAMN05443639_101761 [Stigmatella erecta]
MNQQVANKVNALAVSAYKGLGTCLLVLILLSFITYLGMQAFFLVSEGWVVPTIIAPTDPAILQLNSQIAQQAAARSQLMADRRDVQARLANAERTVIAEQAFQERFQEALKGERAARAQALQRFSALRRQYQHAQAEISGSAQAFAGMARVRTQTLHDARMLDQEAYLTSNHQLAQMAQSQLTLAEHAADLENRLEGLQRELLGFDSVQARGRSRSPQVTTAALLLEREYTRSLLEQARAENTRSALKEDLQGLDEAVARYDQLLKTIRDSPYLRAFEGNLTVAFVPYDNLDASPPGTPLYACRAKLVWCHQVGVVGQAQEGEVSVKHPIRQHFVRGVMVEVHLQDGLSVQEELLHLGQPPLLL